MFRIRPTSWLLSLFAALLQVLVFPTPNWYALGWVCLAPLLLALFTARRAAAPQRNPEAANVSASRQAALARALPQQPFAAFRVATPGQGFVLGFISGVAWYLGSTYWIFTVMHDNGRLSTGTSLGILLLFSFYLALHHAIFGAGIAWLAQPQRFGLRALAFAPPLWVALELLRCRVVGFPWDLLGSSQIDNTPLAHLSTFTGVYGLSFALLVINAAFTAALLVPKSRRGVLLLAAVAGAAVMQSGVLLHPPVRFADRYAVLVQGNIPILDASGWTPEYFRHTVDELVALSHSPTEDKNLPPLAFPRTPNATPVQPGGTKSPELIVWPENPAPFVEHDARLNGPLGELARSSHANLIVGGIGIDPAKPGTEPNVYNSAMLFAADGQQLGRYDKIHLVPWGEFVPFSKLFFFVQKLTREVGTFNRGTSRTPFLLIRTESDVPASAPDGTPDAAPTMIRHTSSRAGTFICYESVFPDEIRQFAKNGAEYFVNLSNDGWYGDSSAWQQHLNMARMRAVENQRWLLFDTNTGLTASIDPDGRIVASIPRRQPGALLAPFAALRLTTFYTEHGDLFALACAIISLVALLWHFRFRAKT